MDVRKDGTPMPVDVLGASFTYRGEPHSLAVVRDITEQERAYELLEQRVEERTLELSTLLHVSRHLTSTLEIDTVLGQFLERLHDVIAYSHATLVALEGGTMRVRAYRGSFAPDVVLAIRYAVRHSPDEPIIASRRPLLIADVHADTADAREFRERRPEVFLNDFANTHCHMRVPLIVKDKVAGVLTLHHPEPDHYTPHDVELALAFADQAAVALENARLFEATQRRAEQFRVIGEMGYRITSILAVDELLAQTVRLIRETFGFYHIHIGLIEEGRVRFKREAGLWCYEGSCSRCETLLLPVGATSLPGEVAESGKPILVPDVTRDPRFISLAPDTTGSELVLPLKVKGRVIGVLDLESEQVNGFDSGDVTVLQSFANQTAVAIENARLYEQSQQLAALEERQKLARELHDSVSQALYGIALGARTARTQLDREPSQVAEPLDYVLALSEAALAEMRALIFELRPESLATEGLVAALEKQAASLRARHHFDVRLALEGEPRVTLEVKQALYRIAQEALHNIVKHARASRVELMLQQSEAGLRLEVCDNGRGFDVGQSFPGHLGLQSMRERAERLGGVLEITSAPGEGAHIGVRLPNNRLAR